MKVEIIDIMGNDLSVVNAARVSYAKVKEKFDDSDDKLIKYLAEHNHWSPFAHTFLSFRIEAPIFVARQLVKHQIGLVWNEESRRYIDSVPTLHKIKQWREKPKNSKQGSGDQIVIDNQLFNEVQAHNTNSIYLYNKLIEANSELLAVFGAKLSNALYHLTGKGLPNRSKQQMELLDDLIDIHSEEYIANKLKSLFS